MKGEVFNVLKTLENVDKYLLNFLGSDFIYLFWSGFI